MTHNYVPQASMSRPLAKSLNVPYALANRLVGVYNQFLYVDAPNRSKVGVRSSQILLGSSFPSLRHLTSLVADSKLGRASEWLLAAAGYIRASGTDAIALQMLMMTGEETEDEPSNSVVEN